MKQYINLKQINKLNIYQLNKLNLELLSPWWKEAKECTLHYSNELLGKMRQWCNIGRMLEFIYYESKNINIYFDYNLKQWEIIFIKNFDFNEERITYKEVELADVLWKATLYYINNKFKNNKKINSNSNDIKYTHFIKGYDKDNKKILCEFQGIKQMNDYIKDRSDIQTICCGKIKINEK